MYLPTDNRLVAIVLSSRFRQVAVGLFVVGLILDTVTTSVLISHPWLEEKNPFVDTIMATIGPIGLVAFKLFLPGTALTVFRRYLTDEKFTWSVNVMLAVCGTMWSAGGMWNIYLTL